MNLDDRLDRARDELADEVAADVRVPSFEGVLARRAGRRRLQAAVGGLAVVVVAAGVVGGIAATRPDASRSVPPAATVSASPPPSGSASASPTAAPSSAQTYPAKGSSYVVVPDGDQLAWTDLKTGAHGHFGPAGQVSSPSVSADGRRVAFLEAISGGRGEIDYWDLDTHTGGAVRQAPEPRTPPAISPDGSRIIWSERSGIHLVAIGDGSSDVSALSATIGPAAEDVTWDGNDAIAYLPGDRNGGGSCAVVRLVLSAGGSTHCLLPTATLQSVFAQDGSTWQITSISGSAGGSILALGVTTTDQSQRGIALLDTSAEATPFRVLPATIVSESGPSLHLGPPVLLGTSRVLYQQAQGGGNAHVLSVDLATGEKTEVSAAFGGDLELGLGATSG